MTDIKEFTNEEDISSEDYLLDQNGVLISKEEAIDEEAKLENMLNNWFVSQSNTFELTAEELDDDYEDDVYEEDIAKTNQKFIELGSESVSKTEHSLLERALIAATVNKLVSDLNNESVRISEELSNSLLSNHNLIDNLIDTYRKERGQISSVVFGDDIFIENAPANIQKKINRQARLTLDKVFYFFQADKHEEIKKELEESKEKIGQLEEVNRGMLSILKELNTKIESLEKRVV